MQRTAVCLMLRVAESLQDANFPCPHTAEEQYGEYMSYRRSIEQINIKFKVFFTKQILIVCVTLIILCFEICYVDAFAQKNIDKPRLFIQTNHAGNIRNLTFDSSGLILASAGQDQTIKLWNATTGRQICTLHKGNSSISCLSFDTSGTRLVSGSDDGTITIWNVQKAKTERTVVIPGHKITSVKFDTHQKYILCSTDDGMVHVWSLESSKFVREWPGGLYLSGIVYRDNEQMVACATDDTTSLWNPDKGEVYGKFAGGGKIALSLTGHLLADVLSGGIHVWDINQGNSIWNTKIVAVKSKTTHIIEMPTSQTPKITKIEHPEELAVVNSLAFSTDGSMLAACFTNDRNVYIWQAKTGSLIRKISPSATPETIAFRPGTPYVAVGCSDGTIEICDAISGEKVTPVNRNLNTQLAPSSSVSVSPDGTWLARGQWDESELWNIVNARYQSLGKPDRARRPKDDIEIALPHGFDYPLTAYTVAQTFTPDGKLYATVGGLKFLSVWKLDKERVTEQAIVPPSYEGMQSKIATLPKIDTSQDIDRDIAKILDGSAPSRTPLMDVKDVRLLPSGKSAILLVEEGLQHWNLSTGRLLHQLSLPVGTLSSIDVNWRRGLVAAAFESPSINAGGVRISSFRLDGWHKSFDGYRIVVFNPDGKSIASISPEGNVKIWSVDTNQILHTFSFSDGSVTALAFNHNGKLLAVGSSHAVDVWDIERGVVVHHLPTDASGVTSIVFHPRSPVLICTYSDKRTVFWDLLNKRLIGTLLVYGFEGNWVFFTPEGRFDTNDPTDVQGIQWFMPDEPLYPLSPSVFLRHYYEPRLLNRLLAQVNAQLKPEDNLDDIPPLQSLNRVQPTLSITFIKPESPNTIAVTVKVENVRHEYQRDKDKVMWSGAKDIRLFRDNQLVGTWPDTQEGGLLLEGGVLASNSKATVFEHTFEHIQLPVMSDKKKPQFTAYAFNTDDVKSETSPPKVPESVQHTHPAKPLRPKAYLISMGVSAYQNSAWSTLDFAANDAAKVVEELTPRLKNQFEVVPILLTSDKEMLKHHQPITATKQNLEDVLAVLSGRKSSTDLTKAQRQQIISVSTLERAHPEDLVVVFFSGHGDQAVNKNWQEMNLPRNISYLFPYDIGKGTGKVTPAREKCISSEELAFWLRNVDAGNIVLIVDACHAAATVGKKFKPGPLGSRGMGQLAYDKAMRVLVATQSDAQALEVNLVQGKRKIQQGLLTYALINEGLLDGRAGGTKNGPLTLSAWLAYAEQRVPALEKEVLKGALQRVPKGVSVRVVNKGGKGSGNPTQKPQLYDFSARLPGRRDVQLDFPSKSVQ